MSLTDRLCAGATAGRRSVTPWELWTLFYSAGAPRNDPLVLRLKCRFGVEHGLATIGPVDDCFSPIASIPGIGRQDRYRQVTGRREMACNRPQTLIRPDVRCGSFSTELGCRRHVRFTPGRDRWGGHPGSAASCHDRTHATQQKITRSPRSRQRQNRVEAQAQGRGQHGD